MRRAVSFQRPHFHFAEALTAELRLAAERLLRHEAVRADRTRVDLVVHEVDEFDHILNADGDAVFKGFAGAPVEYLEFAVHFSVGIQKVVFAEHLLDVFFRRAVENGRGDLPSELFAHVAEVHFEHLTDIHTRRNAQGVEQDLQGSAVREEGHIRLRQHTGNDTLIAVTTRHLVAHLNFALLRDIDADEFVYARFEFVFILSREHFDVHDDAAFAVRNAEGGISDLSRLFAENGAQQSFFGRKLRFALGGNFADENIAALHFRADAHDAFLVEIFQRVVAHVGNIARDLFLPEFGIPCLRFVFLDVNGGEHVVLDELFGKQDGVLVVVALPLHIADEDIFAERELAVIGGRTVGDDLALRHAIARRNDGALIEAGALIGTLEFL